MKLIQSLLFESLTLQTKNFTAKLIDTMEILIEFNDSNVTGGLYLELNKHSQSQLDNIEHEVLGDEIYFDVSYTIGNEDDINGHSVVSEGMITYHTTVANDDFSRNPNISQIEQYWDGINSVEFDGNGHITFINLLNDKGVIITPSELTQILLKFGEHMVDVVT